MNINYYFIFIMILQNKNAIFKDIKKIIFSPLEGLES